jgi:hypothetical protein
LNRYAFPRNLQRIKPALRMKKILLLSSLLLMIISISCKKSSGVDSPAPTRYVSGIGTNDGAATSKSIGAAGGTISSADGRINVQVPAGALAANKTITIQPITNKLPNGTGKAYRITSHDVQFAKPVSISFKYTTAELQGMSAGLMGIAYQDSAGGWRSMEKTLLDPQNKTISIQTTHFSDWGMFPVAYIDPAEARVKFNESLTLRAMGCLSKEDMNDSLPDPEDWNPVYTPFELPGFLIKKWNYNGEGKLSAGGARGIYTAPGKQPNANPEAVSVELKIGSQGTFLLVSNITVLQEFHIEYLQVDETEMSSPQSTYTSRLLIYGNFGDDPGETERSVNLNAQRVKVIFWTPKLILCDIPATGENSSGTVMVATKEKVTSKLLNEWTVKIDFEKVQSPGGSLTKRASMHIRLRGDAIDYPAGGLSAIVTNSDINKASKAIVTMPSGTFTTNVSGDGCGIYNVKWDAINNQQIARGLYSRGNDSLRGRVIPAPTGFRVTLKMLTNPIVRSTQTYTPCIGQVQTKVRMEPISLGEFDEVEFELKFVSPVTRTSIAAGELPIVLGTGAATGLFWDAVDVNPQLFSEKIRWSEAVAKYQ